MKHLQASGIKKGQWVTCNAKVKCRNGGTHVDDNVLTQIQKNFEVHGKNVPLSKITEEDVKKFEKSANEEHNTPDFRNSVEEINQWLDSTYPGIKTSNDAKIPQLRKRKYAVPRPDFIKIEEKLQKGETLFKGVHLFQIGAVLASDFRKRLTDAGLAYEEDKLGWGELLFTVRYNNATSARAYCTIARMVHWAECEDIADEFASGREKLISRNKLLKATFRKPIEVPLSNYTKKEIVEGLFDGSLIHKKVDDHVYILENPVVS